MWGEIKKYLVDKHMISRWMLYVILGVIILDVVIDIGNIGYLDIISGVNNG